MKRLRFTGLWRHPEFMKLWTGQTISLFGSSITALGLPLTAVAILHASALQMGILTAVGQLPPLMIGLYAGVWVDRIQRRPILISADIGRAVLLGSIPVAAVLGLLGMSYLYAVSFLVGILSIFFNVAYRSFLPSVIGREDIVEGNSKLQLSGSASRIIAPNLSGALVQILTAPVAITGDAISFVISAILIRLIRANESTPPKREERKRVLAEIREGLSVVVRNPYLRAMTGNNGTADLFWGMQQALLILYMKSELGIPPVWIGTVLAIGNIGMLVGTLVTKRVTQRLGLGPTIIWAPIVSILGAFLVPVAGFWKPFAVPILLAAQFMTVSPLLIHGINQVSLQQSITPDHMLGRVNATVMIIERSLTPVGAFLGGVLAAKIGLQPTLFVAAAGLFLAIPWTLFSPLRSLSDIPQQKESAAS